MASDNKKDLFWISYSDFLTSLFFIMLVLFVLSFFMMKNIISATEKQLSEIKKIQNSLKELDPRYYAYDKNTSRYKLKIDVQFPTNNSNIFSLPPEVRNSLVIAGKQLFQKIDALDKKAASNDLKVDYLLVIEGTTEIFNGNQRIMPDVGYKLSYNRALSLVNFWEAGGYDFKKFKNCEIIIAGSGYFGKSRNTENESDNRKFSIQITPKIGEFRAN